MSDVLGEENKCEKNEEAAKKTSVFDQVALSLSCRSPLVLFVVGRKSADSRSKERAKKKKGAPSSTSSSLFCLFLSHLLFFF